MMAEMNHPQTFNENSFDPLDIASKQTIRYQFITVLRDQNG